MGAPMPIVSIQLDCGHSHEQAEWISGDRRIICETCGRVWILTAVKARTTAYQTKTEIRGVSEEDDGDS